MAAPTSDEIIQDLSHFLKLYKSGRVERFTGQDFVPPSLDPTTGVQSKDIIISPETNLSARLFLPSNPNTSKKIPLLIYFHGGGFAIQSPFSSLFHKHLNFLVAESNVIAVSVNYRLVPEHPIPIPFEDSWKAIKWVASQYSENDRQEDWIKDHADPSRVYFGGDSAGGNIAHRMAIRFGIEKLDGIILTGIILNCPFFGGEDVIGDEGKDELRGVKVFLEKFWVLACPGLEGYDEPWINPGKDEDLSRLGCGRVLFYVAEKDYLKDRGWLYKEVLEKSGWGGSVEVVEVKGEDHMFSVFVPDGENGLAMLRKVASFINE